MTSAQVIKYAARTDVGKTRKHNEDCYRVNTALGLFVVADGMGGHASGEVASDIAVNTIEQQIMQGADLVEAIEQAHHAIIKGVTQGAGKRGMGTTVVAVQLRGCDYTLAWVGDSRAYLWDGSNGGARQISKDHSLVQMLVDSGQISEAEARVHPRRNVIYQNLGATETGNFQVSVNSGSLYKNQKIILCSDGLSDEVDAQEINSCIAAGQGDDEIADRLVTAALKNGGSDNVSVIVISAPANAQDKPVANEVRSEVDKDTLVPDA